MRRPPFLARSSEVAELSDPPPPPFAAETFAARRDLGAAAGSRALSVEQLALPAGARTGFARALLRGEVFVYVLSGQPTLRFIEPHKPAEEHPLAPGDALSFPAGTGIAFAILNRSEQEASLLVVSEREPSERIAFPEDPLYESYHASQRPLSSWILTDKPEEDASWPPARIETDRLVIRPWRPEDAHDLLASQIRNQPHLARFMPWAKELPTLDELYERILGWQIREPGQREIVYGVFLPDGTPIGGTGYHNRVGELGIELGYWIDFAFERKGYVTEWVAALTRLAFERQGLDRVEIRCDPANTRSAAVPARLGFTREALLPRRARGSDGRPADSLVFCLYASAWRETPCATSSVRAWDDLGRRLI